MSTNSKSAEEELTYMFYDGVSPETLTSFLVNHPDIDINAIVDRYTPIQYSCRFNYPELASILLDHPKIDLKDQRIYYYATTYIKDQNVLQRILQKLQEQAPEEYNAEIEKVRQEKEAKDKREAMRKAQEDAIEIYKNAGAVVCKRCLSYFFRNDGKTEEQRHIEQSVKLRMAWQPEETGDDLDDYMHRIYDTSWVDMSTIKQNTVCLSHLPEGKIHCVSPGLSFPGCCRFSCCQLAHNHPGCMQYREHTE